MIAIGRTEPTDLGGRLDAAPWRRAHTRILLGLGAGWALVAFEVQVIGVAAPWAQNVQVSGFMGPNVTASVSPDLKHMNRSDTITCTIIQDGVQVAQNSATGPNASVSCMK